MCVYTCIIAPYWYKCHELGSRPFPSIKKQGLRTNDPPKKHHFYKKVGKEKNITYTKRLGKKKTSLIQKGWERKKTSLLQKGWERKKTSLLQKVGKEKKHHFYKKVGKEKNHLLIFVRPLFRATARLKPLGILRRRLRPEILTSILSERHRVFFPTKKKQNTTWG